MLENKKIKRIQELTERGRSVRSIAKKLGVSTKTVVKYHNPNHIANGQEKEELGVTDNTPQAEVILMSDDPQWQRFATICNKLGNLGKESPKDVLTLLLRAYSNVAERSGNLNLKMRG